MLAHISVSISYSDPTAESEKRSQEPVDIFHFTAGHGMDPSPPEYYSPRQNLQYRRSSPALQQQNIAVDTTRSQAFYSSPLPQRQWSDARSPVSPEDPRQVEPRSAGTSTWDWQPSPVRTDTRSSRFSTGSRRSRLARGMRDLLVRGNEETEAIPHDISLLYPQMNPYGDRRSMSSAPDELQQAHIRSSIYNNDPGYIMLESPDTPVMTVPRAPTYPPSGRRRMHSSTGVVDADFADEEEFHLFVQATAGLGPDPTFRQPHSFPSSAAFDQRLQPDVARPIIPFHLTLAEDTVSPTNETPTTLHALQHLAQMPEPSRQSHRVSRLQPATHLGMMPQPPRPATVIGDITDVNLIEDDVRDYDDELPDYAQSQAEAQAHRREAAAKRAQELQRRWHLSGARRGI